MFNSIDFADNPDMVRPSPLRPRPETPRTLSMVPGRIREDPSFPAMAADWLSSAFGDRKSYSGFLARCKDAWRGELPVTRLVSIYDQRWVRRRRTAGRCSCTRCRAAPATVGHSISVLPGGPRRGAVDPGRVGAVTEPVAMPRRAPGKLNRSSSPFFGVSRLRPSS